MKRKLLSKFIQCRCDINEWRFADPARVTYNPSVQYLPLGLPGILRCFYESNPPILYMRWTKDNVNIVPDTAAGVETLKNNGSLYFDKIKEQHQGRYTCAPYNLHGSAGVSNIMEVLVRRK